MTQIEKDDINFSKHLTRDDWAPPTLRSKEILIALIMLLLYPLCFASGLLVAHFLHI